MLRAQGVPARVRSGFGTYFNHPYFEDHWVCEFWRTPKARWALADPQFDHVWRPGTADPNRFGIDFAGLRGLWFVAGSLVRDVAALNKVEMLPWDVWGAQPGVDATLDAAQLGYFDRLAALTGEPDASFEQLRSQYPRDEGLRVPGTVLNALRNRPEPIPEAVRAVPPGGGGPATS